MKWVNTSPAFLMQWAGPPLLKFPLDGNMQLECYIQHSEDARLTRYIFKVVDPINDPIVGHIELDNIDAENRSATLCRVLVAEEFRGRSLCPHVVRLMLQFGFVGLGLHWIDLRLIWLQPAHHSML